MLVRTLVTTEPEWDDEQREVVLEYQRYRREMCPDCGGQLSITRDKSRSREVRDQKVTCWDCDVIEKHRQSVHAGHGDKNCDCASRTFWVEGYSPL